MLSCNIKTTKQILVCQKKITLTTKLISLLVLPPATSFWYFMILRRYQLCIPRSFGGIELMSMKTNNFTHVCGSLFFFFEFQLKRTLINLPTWAYFAFKNKEICSFILKADLVTHQSWLRNSAEYGIFSCRCIFAYGRDTEILE